MAESFEFPVSAKYLAEFCGTFMLVLTVGFNVLTGSSVWAVTSIACTLMVMIWALGCVSGANFNPAVSFALGIAGKMNWQDVGGYCCVQLAAGICAGMCYELTIGDMFNLSPTPGFEFWQAGLAEFLYTFMLCFVVLNVACSKVHAGKNEFYGLAIGFVVIAGGYGAGHISGGCFNPAVAVGIDVSSLDLGFGWCCMYIVAELAGAFLAAVFFGLCRPEEKDEALEVGKYKLSSKVVSEFLGTYMLVLTVGLNVLGGSKAPVLSIASALMCMIFALGSCSGAHFNPAVTVAILGAGRNKISPKDAGVYICAQVLGGLAAAFTYSAMENGKTFPLGPGKGYDWMHAAGAEIIFTFLLCFVVLSVATIQQPLSEYFGLAIGSCVTAGGYAIGAVSGGSLNPAVSFGIATSSVMNGGKFENCLIYSLFELVGAGIAIAIFRVTHPSEFVKE